MDCIEILGQKFKVYLGWTEAERDLPQQVTVNIKLGLDLNSCMKSDALSDTVDYVQVIDALRELTENSSWKLLEKLTADAADFILLRFKMVKNVTVTAVKQTAGSNSRFSVSIKRER